MNPPGAPAPGIALTEPACLPGWLRSLRRGENLLVVAALAVMTILPVTEVILRHFFRTGISASATIVQHLVLAVGMLGGAVAARENRLLALSAAAQWFQGGLLTLAHVVGYGFAAAVSTLLCAASWQFVVSQKSLGKILFHFLGLGVPAWVVQLLLVVGFGLVAVRLILNASPRWRVATLALAVAFIAVIHWAPVDPQNLRWPAIIVLLIAVAMGAPISPRWAGPRSFSSGRAASRSRRCR